MSSSSVPQVWSQTGKYDQSPLMKPGAQYATQTSRRSPPAKASDPLRDALARGLSTVACIVVTLACLLVACKLFGSHQSEVTTAAPPISLLSQGSTVSGLDVPPKGDHRKYKFSVLPNGLQVINVEDNRTLQKAFAMAVEAGSFDDPPALPGLAHFCEHMLFLGTKKYPEASGFDNFMSANGGFNNAYTASEVTVYFAEVSQTNGAEALDRFADFFRAPLFDKKYVSKEVHAIDSEHAKNVQDPTRRVLQVAYSLANPKSPLTTFHTGDVETLYNTPKKQGIDPVEELKVYFNNNYCPKKMRLVTYGSQPLAAQLAETKKQFSSLAAKSSKCGAAARSFAKPEPWGAKRMGQFVHVKGTLPQAEMWLHFSLPDISSEYKSQPMRYVEYMLSYGGEDSLSRVLQDSLGLVTGFQPMVDMSSAGTNFFVVMHLTKRGHENMDLILNVFYTYLGTLRKKGVDKQLYESLGRVAKLKWDWSEESGPSDTASDLAERMTRLPVENLLSGDELITTVNSSLVSSLLKSLTPANMNVIYVESSGKKGKDNSSSASPPLKEESTSEISALASVNDNAFRTLPHYGVEYAVQKLSEAMPGAAKQWQQLLAGASATDLASKLPRGISASGSVIAKAPQAIKGVPTNIPLDHMHTARTTTTKGNSDAELYGSVPKRLGQSAATKLVETGESHESIDLWYRSGWATTSPKAQLQMALRPLKRASSPEVSARDSLRLSIFSRLLDEAMAPSMVDLTATGVGYGIDVDSQGLSFTFSGFTPMMPTLISKVLRDFNDFNGNTSATLQSRFDRVTQELRENLKTYSEMPVTYAIQDRNMLLARGAHSRAESLKALSEVTRKSSASSVSEVLFSQPLRLTSLAMGNIAEDEANTTVHTFADGLHMPKGTGIHSKQIGLPETVSPVVKIVRPVEVRANNPRAGDPNDAVVLSLVAGVSTIRSRVLLGLLGQVLNAVAYNELRTARQLGYVVNAGASQMSNVQYISCIVQGKALKADAVEAAIEHVLTQLMPKRLAELTEKEFGAYKESFRQELLRPPLRFQDEISHFWGPVTQGGQCFNLRSSILKYLDESFHSKDALIKEWASLATPSTGVRRKITVKYFAGSVPRRPTEKEAAATWKEQGVPESAVALLRREYGKANVFDHVDSQVRKKLVEEGGHFPLDLHCDLEKTAPAPSPHFLKPISQHRSK